ncbi:hypothetical protein ACA910_007907 [Epithemia clementina (nom. ined.)]
MELLCDGIDNIPIPSHSISQTSEAAGPGGSTKPNNGFRWSDVILNLPGDIGYNPSLPWVRRVRENGDLAADVHLYVDDLQETAPSELEAWEASSKMAKTALFYGLQDAACKRRAPSKSPGAWASAVIKSTPYGVFKLVSDERWLKVEGRVATLQSWIKPTQIDRKALEQIRGFLVYVTLTYGSMTPYLKDIHLRLDS